MKSWNEMRKAATAFSKRWKDAYDEKSQAQSFLMRRLFFVAVCLATVNVCIAAVVTAPRLPEPVSVGTEVSTNIAFASTRSDLRSLEIGMEFSGAASNCVQMAFGRDANGDGVLAPEETSLALGWRGGRYFIEDAGTGIRLCEDASAQSGDSRSLVLHVSYGGDSAVKSATVRDESNNVRFAASLAARPEWLLGLDWDLCRVTRRGVDSPSELCYVSRGYGYFHVFLK